MSDSYAKSIDEENVADMNIRVIKLGGSLLTLPDLKQVFSHWLSQQSNAVNIIVVGGGKLVNDIRAEHERAPLDDTEAHWRCIDAMSENSQTIAAAFQLGPLVRNYQQLRKLLTQDSLNKTATNIIFDPQDFLANHEPQIAGTPLEIGWHVTSDSIAAPGG